MPLDTFTVVRDCLIRILYAEYMKHFPLSLLMVSR